METRPPLSEKFKSAIRVESPGRINLIGEHTDYNEGFVLPAAIDKTINLELGANGSPDICRVRSKGFKEMLVVDLNNFSKSQIAWHNYILGVLFEIQQLTDKLTGFDCTIESNLPVGSGVSSSAALECGLATGLNELFDLQLDKWDIIKLCQRAEHNFVGTQCGIMDQFANVMGKRDHALFLDCQSLHYEMIPLEIHPYCLLLLNTNVAHALADGEYNKRRRDCQDGVNIIRQSYPEIHTLREVDMEMIRARRKVLGERLFHRCTYVVQENTRVLQACRALKENDLKEMGELMYASHLGLKDLFEVSCAELDFLVDFSRDFEAVLGARMMGGGFGGCTLNIIHKDGVGDFVDKASKVYRQTFNIDLFAFETLPSDGCRVIRHS